MRLRFSGIVARMFLREMLPVFGVLGGLLVASILGTLIGANSESAVRWAGTLLQVSGLLIAATGLLRLGRYFDLPPIFPKWWQLLKGIFIQPEPVLVQVSGAIGIGGTGTATVTTTLPLGAPLHKRIALLETDVKTLRAALLRTQENHAKDLQATRDAINKGLRDRGEEIQRVAQKLKESQVGGLRLAIVGLLWLLFGTVAAGIPHEIACALHRACS